MEVLLGQVAAATALYLELALLIGVLLTEIWLSRGTASHEAIRPDLTAFFLSGWGLAVGGCAVTLWLQAAVMADMPALRAGPAVWTMLTETDYGKWGMARLSLLVLLAAIHLRVPSDSPSRREILASTGSSRNKSRLARATAHASGFAV